MSMLNNFVNSKVNHKLNGWNEPIQEAKQQLEALEERKKGLLQVLATFEKFKSDGEPWPLKNETAGTAVGSNPANTV